MTRPALRPALAALAALLLPAAALAQAAPEMPATRAHAHPLAGRIVATADGASLPDPEALVAALARADVAVLGETHDNPEHHAAQAWLTEALAPAGVAFEMIPRASESRLAALRAEGAGRAAIGAALDWEARGWPDFAMYAPILEAAPQAEITGGAVERDAASAAMREGAAAAARAAIGAAAPRYGLGAALPEALVEEAAAEQVAAHCDAIPLDVGRRMVEAQRLRDAAFADAVLRARALGGAMAGDAPARVVLIAGAGHARKDRGAPAALRAAEPDLRVASLALVEVVDGAQDWRAYAEPQAGGAPLYDYVWFTAPAEREDPCAAFKARAKP